MLSSTRLSSVSLGDLSTFEHHRTATDELFVQHELSVVPLQHARVIRRHAQTSAPIMLLEPIQEGKHARLRRPGQIGVVDVLQAEARRLA